MALHTRLTEMLSIEHPIISAPMAFAAGGNLAAAITGAGGFGLIGGGYGDAEWLEREFSAARNARIGCGFITWSLAKRPELLDLALAHSPTAVMLSFGSPMPFVARIKAAGARLICQGKSAAQQNYSSAFSVRPELKWTCLTWDGLCEPTFVAAVPCGSSCCRARCEPFLAKIFWQHSFRPFQRSEQCTFS